MTSLQLLVVETVRALISVNMASEIAFLSGQKREMLSCEIESSKQKNLEVSNFIGFVDKEGKKNIFM